MKVRFREKSRERFQALLSSGAKFFAQLSGWFSFVWSRMFRHTYFFRVEDLVLYFRERSWVGRPKEIQIEVGDNDDAVIYAAGGRFFWPKELETEGIDWMYREVFFPFEDNPCSYSHPRIDYGSLAWLIDGGACEGFYSRKALTAGARKVFSFEPHREISRALAATFSEEIAENRLVVLAQALDEETEEIYFDENNLLPWESKIAIEGGVGNATGRVLATSVDSFVEKERLRDSGRGLIKLDVEGFEMRALRGAAETLRTAKPILAIAVYHEYENAALCREIVLKANPTYEVEFRGFHSWTTPGRPYMMFAF